MIRRALLLLVATVGLSAAAMIPGNEIVTFPPELPDAGGVAVAVRYGEQPGELVLRFEPSAGRPMVMAIPEGGESNGVSGPVVLAAGQTTTVRGVRYQPPEAIDPRAGTNQAVEATLDLRAVGPVGPLVELMLVVSYSVPGERLVVERRLSLPLSAQWLPP